MGTASFITSLTVSFTGCTSCRTLQLGWCSGWRRMIISPLPCVLCIGCPSDSASSSRFGVSSSNYCSVMSLNTLWICCGITNQRDTCDRQARISLPSLCPATAIWPPRICHSGAPPLELSSTVTDRLSVSPVLQEGTRDSFVQDRLWQPLTETRPPLKCCFLVVF